MLKFISGYTEDAFGHNSLLEITKGTDTNVPDTADATLS